VIRTRHSLIAPASYARSVRRSRCRECGHRMRWHRGMLLTDPPVMLCARCPFGICPDAEGEAEPTRAAG
jgi:hypothetical protein